MEYKEVSSHESSVLGLKMMMIGWEPSQEEKNMISRAVGEVYQQLLSSRHRNDPVEIRAAADEYNDLVACFGNRAIFVEKTGSGYDSKWGRPWLIVTTAKGRILVGWRKRVIVLDWEGSTIETNAETMFPNEDTTKDGRMVHAWGYSKLKEYIDVLLR